ncbi:ATP-binding protein [Kitasatospora sp. P5_F3]
MVTGSGAVYRLTVTATAPNPGERLACVAPARAALRSAAAGWGVTGGAPNDLVTIVGELLANAALHTGPARLPMRLLLAPTGRTLRVEVDDPSDVRPLEVTASGDEQALTGRGLLMVGALAKSWGATLTAGGKTVWAEIDLETALDPASVNRTAFRDRAWAGWRATARMGTTPTSAPWLRPARTAPKSGGRRAVGWARSEKAGGG